MVDGDKAGDKGEALDDQRHRIVEQAGDRQRENAALDKEQQQTSQESTRIDAGTVRRLRTQKLSMMPLMIQPGSDGTRLACRLVGQSTV